MRQNRWTSILFGVAAILATSAPQIYAQQPALVTVDEVKTLDFHDQVTLIGRTQPQIESKIVAEVSGKISAIDATEGVYVDKGTPLIRVDDTRARFSFESKKAEAEQARLRSELAASQLERARELARRDLISSTGLDSAVAWATMTRENYNQLDAEVERLRFDLDHCVIRAPFDGYTGLRLVGVGEWVSPGMPVFEMTDLSHIKVKVDLPEKYFGHVKLGSRVSVAISGSASTVISGQVIGVSPNANDETHTFPVIIDVPNSHGTLAGGMLVRATLTLNEEFSSLAVSKDAIVRQGEQTLVYTVVDGKATPIPVRVRSSNGEMVAVETQGLQEGMPVVIRGNERIFPNLPVQVQGGTSGQSEQGPAASANNEGASR